MEAIAVHRNTQKYNASLVFSKAELRIIKNLICGNYLLDHLSPHSNVADAKKILTYMSVVLNFDELPVESRHLIECILGWSVDNIAHKNENANSRDSVISSKALSMLRKLKAADLELHKFGLELINHNFKKNYG